MYYGPHNTDNRENAVTDKTIHISGLLLPKAIVIDMRVMVAMWGAHTLVASSAEARMNSCDASSQAGITEGKTTS